jgi:hypothetical protein
MNLQCVNPDCSSSEFDQPGGSIWLMEFEASREELTGGDDNGFPINSMPLKCFWLCAQCSQLFVLSRWTDAGIVLAPRPNWAGRNAARSVESQGSKSPIRIFASANIESEFREAV